MPEEMAYPHPYTLNQSTEFCGYQPVKELGSGSYGQVSEVTRYGTSYALKLERFRLIPGSVLSEVIVSTQCEHPNINSAVDIFFDCEDGYLNVPPAASPSASPSASPAAPAQQVQLQRVSVAAPAVAVAAPVSPSQQVTVLQCNESLSRCRPVNAADVPASVREIPVLPAQTTVTMLNGRDGGRFEQELLADGVVDVPLTPLGGPPPRPLPPLPPGPPPRPLPPLPPGPPAPRVVIPPGPSVKMVAELAPRGTLDDYLVKFVPSFEQLQRIAFQVADGLAFMHENRLVHGDIKPANVLVFRGRAALTDFGLTNFDYGQEQPELIQSGMYRAPEVFLKANSGRPADIWSYGVLLWRVFDDTGFLYPVADVVVKTIDDEKVYFQRALSTLGHDTDWPPTREQQAIYQALMTGQALPRGTYDLPPLVTTDYEIPAAKMAQLRTLLRDCLQVDPRRRLTAEQILRHPFFDGMQRSAGTWHGIAPPIRELVPAGERNYLLQLCRRLQLERSVQAHALDLYQQARDLRKNMDDWRPRGRDVPPASADRDGIICAAIYIAAVCAYYQESSIASSLGAYSGVPALTTTRALMQYVVRLAQLLHYRIQPNNLYMVIGDNGDADQLFDQVAADTLPSTMEALFRERRYHDLHRRFRERLEAGTAQGVARR